MQEKKIKRIECEKCGQLLLTVERISKERSNLIVHKIPGTNHATIKRQSIGKGEYADFIVCPVCHYETRIIIKKLPKKD